ncbi:hypothetical protein Trydic_g19945, partial [Trypoxylus dichotomus]
MVDSDGSLENLAKCENGDRPVSRRSIPEILESQDYAFTAW